MRKFYLIGIGVLATLALQWLLGRTPTGRALLLDLLTPTASPDDGSRVLARDTTVYNHLGQPVGSLPAGLVIFAPCHHDLHLTDPFDPQLGKIYVNFGSGHLDLLDLELAQRKGPILQVLRPAPNFPHLPVLSTP